MAAKPIPEGYQRVTPYLMVEDVPKLMDFLTHVFGATGSQVHSTPDGRVMHAEVRIGDSVIMMAEASAQYPKMPAMIHMYVEDVDEAYARALARGATSVQPVADQFYGDRSGGVQDASGNLWWITTHVEDVSAEEIARRSEAYMKEQAKAAGNS